MSTEKTTYTDEELQEFRELILHKLDQAIKDYDLLRESATDRFGNDAADTQPTLRRYTKVRLLSQRGRLVVWPNAS